MVKKLERFGNFTFIRPDSQAIAEPCLDKKSLGLR
jgi:hypothetical protein